MKLLHYVKSSAFKRNISLQKLESNASQIRDHVIKLLVYGKVRKNDTEHWKHEIATWLSDASLVKSKTPLKNRDYLDTVFSEFGDEQIDCRIILKQFRQDYCVNLSDNPYPGFLITPELVKSLFDVVNKIKDSCIPLLMAKDGTSANEFIPVLNRIFDKNNNVKVQVEEN